MRKKWMLIFVVLLLAAMACVFSTGEAEIADPEMPSFQSQVGGEMRAFVARGNYIYAGSGPHLIVIDQSDHANPKLIGESVVLPDIVQEIALQDDFAYVAAGKGGLRIIDISDPAKPDVVGHYNWKGFAAHVAVDGDTAYVAGNEADTGITGHGLHVIDVGDRNDPKQLSFLRTEGYPNYIAFQDNKVHLQLVVEENDKNAIYITTIDVGDGNNPSEDGSFRITNDASDVSSYPMTMLENLAFVVNKGELKILNMDDAENPDELSSEDLPLQPCGIAVSGDHAYLVGQRAGMSVIDISDRGNPDVKGFYQSPVARCIVTADGNMAYLDRYNGLELVDVADPLQPKPASVYKSPVDIADVAVQDDYAYLVSAEAKFHILRIADRFYPELVGYLEPGQDRSFDIADPIVADGDRVYTGSTAGSLVIINVSDKKNPTKDGSYASASGVVIRAYKILLSADYAYLAAGSDGLLVIDVYDKSKPEKAALLETSNPIRDLALIDTTLFAAARDKGLLSIDVSDPRSPEETGGLTEKLFAGQVFVDGDYAYVPGELEISVLDVSDHESPKKVAAYKLTSAPLAMLLHENKIYLVDAARNLITLEISDHKKFDELSKFELPCSAVGLITDNDYLYIVAQKCGMFIIAQSDLE
jgi:hypothetical protein